MSDIRALVFDYFGVICTEQYEAWLASIKHHKTGQYQKLSQRTDIGELSKSGFFTGLAALSGVSAAQIEADFHHNTDIDHRLISAILQLKKKYKIGLLSNSSLDWISVALDQFHLRSIFDVLVVSGEVGFIKPQPEIYQITLDRLGLAPNQIVFVDDASSNVLAAQKLGMNGVLYNGFENCQKNLAKLGVSLE